MRHWFATYFSFPNGGIWGNVYAEPVCILLAAAVAFLFRDLIGRKLAAWWHKHHGQHMTAELAAMEKRLSDRADQRHEAMLRHVTKETQ